MSKNEIISKIYNDPFGFGSINKTLDEAKQVDKSITIDDVKDWFRKNVEKKNQLKGMNFCCSPSVL
jgi:hypothetical protein